MDFIKNIPKYCIADINYISFTGVYFLFKNNELVYIGKSIDISKRLKNHIVLKEFDNFSFIICDTLYDSDYLERNLINKYKPKLNSTFKNSKYDISIDYKLAKYFNVTIESLIKT